MRRLALVWTCGSCRLALSATSDTQSSRRRLRVLHFSPSRPDVCPSGHCSHLNVRNMELQLRAQLRVGPTDRRRDDHEAGDDRQLAARRLYCNEAATIEAVVGVAQVVDSRRLHLRPRLSPQYSLVSSSEWSHGLPAPPNGSDLAVCENAMHPSRPVVHRDSDGRDR